MTYRPVLGLIVISLVRRRKPCGRPRSSTRRRHIHERFYLLKIHLVLNYIRSRHQDSSLKAVPGDRIGSIKRSIGLSVVPHFNHYARFGCTSNFLKIRLETHDLGS